MGDLMRSFPLLSTAALAWVFTACSTDIRNQGSDPKCSTTIVATYPVDGSSNFYYRDAIEFYLSSPDPTAVVLTEIDGEQYTSEDGKTILFVPNQALDPVTDYEVGLDYCHGNPTISFTTSELGSEIASFDTIEGNTYLFHLDAARYTTGGEVAQALLAIFNKDILIQILEMTNSTIAMRGAVGESIGGEVEQDICYRTIDLEELGVDSADFYYEDAELVMDFYHTELAFLNLLLSGTFAPDGSWIGGVSLYANVDVRGLSETLGLGTADDICSFAKELESPCQPCSTDDAAYCITIAAEKISATAVNMDLEKIELNNSFEECVVDES